MKHEIKHTNGSVLYVAEIPDDTPSGLATRAAMEAATRARANLDGAYLARAYLNGANLDGANLNGAYLDGAYLARASLVGASLVGASLARAYLARANLARANLDGAYLARASLDGANGPKLTGARPVLQIGPIGSRCAYLVSYITDQGVYVRAGCWFGALADFAARVVSEHGTSDHAVEYAAAIQMIEAHARLWAPATEAA